MLTLNDDFIYAFLQNFDLDTKEESSDKDEETQEGKPDSAWSRHILSFSFSAAPALELMSSSDHGCPPTNSTSHHSKCVSVHEKNYDSVNVQLIDLMTESQCTLNADLIQIVQHADLVKKKKKSKKIWHSKETLSGMWRFVLNVTWNFFFLSVIFYNSCTFQITICDAHELMINILIFVQRVADYPVF